MSIISRKQKRVNAVSKTLRLISVALIVVLAILCISSCGSDKRSEDIYILFTNDVHCAADTNIGYAGLSAYKQSIEAKSKYVTLVDVGDAVQGDYVGTVSKGAFSIELMNAVGFDLAVLGNHEFDYGMERLSSLISSSNASYLGCNITYSGSGNGIVSQLKPYEIISYGKVDVAFIGVSTPESITDSTPSNFMENGEFVYDFATGENGQKLYGTVQRNIDECKDKGAEYIVILSHLGDNSESSPYTSLELIQNTTGADVLLDGHAHSEIPCMILDDKDGNEVLLSSTGTELENIGQLVITEEGTITVGLISDYSKKDADIQSKIDAEYAVYEQMLKQKVADTAFALSRYDSDGTRIVRNRETALGNLCADAYRYVSGADIAFVNGGGIRADIEAGEIAYEDVIAVHPYANTICMVKASGQEILDALEFACRSTLAVIDDGENGGFLQVSGIKFTIDTSVASSVTMDENEMFVSVGETRRVKDVYVLSDSGEYLPIDVNAEYTVASHNYMIKEQGDGYTMFADNELLIDEGIYDYEVLISYIQSFANGTISEQYRTTEGRISVK